MELAHAVCKKCATDSISMQRHLAVLRFELQKLDDRMCKRVQAFAQVGSNY